MAEKPEKATKKPEQPAGKPSGGFVAQSKPVLKAGKEVRGIVRLAGKDLKGETKLDRAISQIKGVGERLSRILAVAALVELKLPKDAVIGELTEEQLETLEEMMKNPMKHGVPVWMLNRRRDLETGLDKHFIGTDLMFVVKQDIEREKDAGSWIGYRHNYGQKVRGQHTRTTGRKGMTVGVLRKSVLAKQGAAAPVAGAAAGAGAPAAAAPKGAAAPAAKAAAPAAKGAAPAAAPAAAAKKAPEKK